jgi:FkbM family methyltransferase
MAEGLRKVALLPGVFDYWRRSTGWQAASTWVAHRTKMALGIRPPATISLKPRQARYPVAARLGASSDMTVFQQVFQHEEYGCVRDITPAPELIFDLGANVGYSSAYFLTCFPHARLVAVEPDPANFDLCRKNLAPYGQRARVVCGAVWSKRCRLELSRQFGDGLEWAIQVRESSGPGAESEVEAWDIPSLLQLVGEDRVGLLKVDVERSELEIFGSGSQSWLPKVRNVCIELHGEDCRQTFFAALRGFEYERGRSGELTTCWNLRPRSVQ